MYKSHNLFHPTFFYIINLCFMLVDLIDHGSFFNLASQVSNIVKDKGLNVLINNAGISSKFTRIGLVKSEDLLNHFKINTIGPIMLTQVN